MEDYPSNSRAKKEGPPKPETKKIERVTHGEVIRRKRSLGKKFSETFFGGSDAKSVWGYVALEVLVPATKDAIVDTFTQAIERIFYNDSRPRNRGASRYGTVSGYTNYSRYSSQSRDRRDEPRQMSRRARQSHNFDEIILPSRVEAEEVISSMFEIISKYEQVTVADLYELVGISGEYTDNKWGWTDLRGAGCSRVKGGGYLLDLNPPEPLD